MSLSLEKDGCELHGIGIHDSVVSTDDAPDALSYPFIDDVSIWKVSETRQVGAEGELLGCGIYDGSKCCLEPPMIVLDSFCCSYLPKDPDKLWILLGHRMGRIHAFSVDGPILSLIPDIYPVLVLVVIVFHCGPSMILMILRDTVCVN